jgi:hypothetical protein
MKTRIPSHHLAPRTVRERAYTAQLALLRREMILQRAKDRWAHIEHDAFPFGTGIQLRDGSLIMMTELSVPYFRARRVAKKRTPRYPAKLWWQEKFRLLLKEPGRSRNPVRRAGRSLFPV